MPIDGSKIDQKSHYSLPPSLNLLDPDTMETAKTEHISMMKVQQFVPDDDTESERTEIFHDAQLDVDEFLGIDDSNGTGARRR